MLYNVVTSLCVYDLELGLYCYYEYKWCGQKNACGSVEAIVYSRHLVVSQQPVDLVEEDSQLESFDDIEAALMAGVIVDEHPVFDE